MCLSCFYLTDCADPCVDGTYEIQPCGVNQKKICGGTIDSYVYFEVI
jgi:hypothetical protein